MFSLETLSTLPYDEWLSQLWLWVDTYLLTIVNAQQIVLTFAALFSGVLLARRPIKKLDALRETHKDRWFLFLFNGLRAITLPLMVLLLLWFMILVAAKFEQTVNILAIAANLTMVWIVVRFSSSFVQNASLARWIATAAWIIAALNIFDWLTPTMKYLEELSIHIGGTDVSAMMVIKGLLSFVAVWWGANLLSRFIDRRIHATSALTPSLRVLISKVSRTLLIIIAFFIALNTIGIDLTSLAVFSGAIGVGIGFGLQKVVSNFISGIILLLDRSIKPGDVIAINDTYGWVNRLGARCVSVITRDGKEHLIPNESLITERVENWSYSDKNIRLRISVGVSYGSDVRKALEIIKNVAKDHARILRYPSPNALLREFGDSSVNLELRCWISDPSNGVSNIQSELMLEIWDAFHKQGVEFPFPQRDIYIKNLPMGDAQKESLEDTIPDIDAPSTQVQKMVRTD